jgi:hypothetical protein
LVYEEINKLSAFKYGVVQKQYTTFLLLSVGATETGSLPTYHTTYTTYKNKAHSIRKVKVQCVEDGKMIVIS